VITFNITITITITHSFKNVCQTTRMRSEPTQVASVRAPEGHMIGLVEKEG
jgi:hypothetical protein